MLAAVHLSLAYTLPVALVLGGLGVWGISQLWRGEAPPSRRWIRGVSMAVRIALLGPFVWGLSVVDGDLDPAGYARAWALGVGLLGLSVVIALLDVANTLRLRTDGERVLADQLAALEAEATREPESN